MAKQGGRPSTLLGLQLSAANFWTAPAASSGRLIGRASGLPASRCRIQINALALARAPAREWPSKLTVGPLEEPPSAQPAGRTRLARLGLRASWPSSPGCASRGLREAAQKNRVKAAPPCSARRPACPHQPGAGADDSTLSRANPGQLKLNTLHSLAQIKSNQIKSNLC